MTRAVPGAAAAHVRALAATVAEQSAGVAAGAPAALHDLRVASRRLDAALSLWGGGAAAWAARKAAQELRRATGPAREAEVLRELLARRWQEWAPLPAVRRRAWNEQLSAVRATLPEGAAASMRTFAEAAAARLERHGDRMERAQRRARGWRREFVARFARALESGAAAELHGARLALKLWRYAEESLARVRGETGRPRVERVRPWQQALGELNDLTVLQAFVAARPPAGPHLVPAIERRRLAGLERLRRAVLAAR
jgi:CHAD domain-containing protein